VVRTLCSCRTSLTWGAIALLVAANLHCAFEWQAALHYSGAQLPIESPEHDCENESGCICRGAIVAQAVVAGCLTSHSYWLVLELPPSILESESLLPDRDAQFAGWHCLSPPISGRKLRALYSSFVI
jgi:hypothetical protein